MEFPDWIRALYMRASTPSLVVSGNRSYVRHFYTLWSKVYDLSVGIDPAYRRNVQRVVSSTVRPGDRVLDVGVGTALLAEYGAERAAEYVGLDYSADMLVKAARKVASRRMGTVRLCWGDAQALPFAARRFDVVLSSFTLAHLSPAERPIALAEMGRVLVPGGRLGLNQAPGERFPGFSTSEQIRTWLSQAGFTRIHLEDHDDVYRIVTAVKRDELRE